MIIRDPEILAPAGRVSDIKPLIEAHADAIYVGLKGLSARPESSDFTPEEIGQLLPYIHEHNVKLYVAINGNPAPEEIPAIVQTIVQLDEAGVDAVILSNFGLLRQVSALSLRAALHASTLMGIYNADSVRLLAESGVKRVILSSDLYIDEVAAIIEACPAMEYEIVADGGICFNSNRQCLMPHTGIGENYHVFCQLSYDLYHAEERLGRAHRIGNCPGKLHRDMGIYMGVGVMSYKVEGRTNSLDYILKRLNAMYESKQYYVEHWEDIPGYMHYFYRRNWSK